MGWFEAWHPSSRPFGEGQTGEPFLEILVELVKCTWHQGRLGYEKGGSKYPSAGVQDLPEMRSCHGGRYGRSGGTEVSRLVKC
jgi:hypothetical protein